MIWIGSFALFGQVSIRLFNTTVRKPAGIYSGRITNLNTMLEAVELVGAVSGKFKTEGVALPVWAVIPPSKNSQSGSRPGQLLRQSQSRVTLLNDVNQDRLPGAREENIPFKLMTSLMLGD